MVRLSWSLLGTVCVGILVSGCLGSAAPQELRVPQQRSVGSWEAEWAVEEWPESHPLPVYKTERACCTGADLARAANALDVPIVPHELDWPDYVSIGTDERRIRAGIDDGRVVAEFLGATSGAAPDGDAVAAKARPLLEKAGLWPAGGVLVPTGPTTSASSTRVVMNETAGTSEATVRERRVSFGAELEALPVVGVPHLRVGYGKDGAISEVSVLWPKLVATEVADLEDPATVPDLFAARQGSMDSFCGTARFTEADLVYYVGAPGWGTERAFPAWRVRGECTSGEGTATYIVSAVAGAHEGVPDGR